MDISPKSESFITVKEDARQLTGKNAAPTVEHWHTSAKTNCFPAIAADLVMTLDPQLSIIFVPTKVASEDIASFLRSKIGGADVHALHGDMTQASRSKSIATIRKNTSAQQILVATDVASRGLDLPNVDLVVQFGVPKLSGRDGTYNTELYTHRTGRAGRVGMSKSANTVLLYDHAAGEGKFIADLAQEVNKYTKHKVRARAIPGTAQILDAGYRRAASQCLDINKDETSNSELDAFFKSKLAESSIDTSDPEQLIACLSKAMASLSRLDPAVSPFESHSSLLTGDTSDRTLRVYRDDGKAVTPPEVTRFCKTFGSGKLARVTISANDGSAVFDLPKKRAKKLVNTVASTEEELFGWNIEMPMHLP
jgi:superfamily II DNA/RNA helicase